MSQSRTMHPVFVYIRKNRGVETCGTVTFLGYARLMTLKYLLKRRVRRRVAAMPLSSAIGVDNAGLEPPMKAPALVSALLESRHPPTCHGWARDPPPPGHGALAGTEISAPATPASGCRKDLEALSGSSTDPPIASTGSEGLRIRYGLVTPVETSYLLKHFATSSG